MQHPSLDSWTIIFLNFSALGFFLFVFFFSKKSSNSLSYRLIGVYMLLYSVMMVEYVFFWTRYLTVFPHLSGISAGFPFLFGPILLLYFRLSYGQNKLTSKSFLHLVPFIIFTILFLPYHLASGDQKMHFTEFPALHPTYWKLMGLMPWVKILHNIIYLLLMYRFISQQSSVGEMRRWSNLLMIFFLSFILGSISYYTLVNFSWFNNEWDYFISFIISAGILCTAWFAFAYPSVISGYSLKQSISSLKENTFLDFEISASKQFRLKTVFPGESTSGGVFEAKSIYPVVAKAVYEKKEEKHEEIEPFIKYKNSSLTPAAAVELKLQLESLMQTEKLYRENNLKLEILSNKLKTTRHNLSQVLNEHLHYNFFDYINFLRIEEAKELLRRKSKSELNIIEIAYAVGFNNKVTFNNAFKKFTGYTPTEFRQNNT